MKKELNGVDMIQFVIVVELGLIMATEGAAFSKFVLLAASIEFLGACLDKELFEQPSRSEERFNKALNILLKGKYIKYAKADSSIKLFSALRCGMVHAFRPGHDLELTTRKHVSANRKHLINTEGKVAIVLEELYKDILRPSKRLIKRFNDGKLPSMKLEEKYMAVEDGFSGHTQHREIKDYK